MRGLVPRLGRGAWVILAADLLSAVGTGMTLPFLLVYLHSVRGLSLPVAGAAAASIAAAASGPALLAGLITACCLAAVLALGLARWLAGQRKSPPGGRCPSPSSLACPKDPDDPIGTADTAGPVAR